MEETIQVTVTGEPSLVLVEPQMIFNDITWYDDLPTLSYFDLRTARTTVLRKCGFPLYPVTNLRGIWPYRIPEFGAVGEDTRLAPVWNRLLDASDCRGTL